MNSRVGTGRYPVGRLISGGQTGVDRATLEFALEQGFPCGGWCPAGRRSEDGPIPDLFPLRETGTVGYPQRTRQNVRDSDATLIITRGPPQGGTALTVRLALQQRRPHLVIDLGRLPLARAARAFLAWLWTVRPTVLNVAGPRASETPGLGERVKRLLEKSLVRDEAEPPAWPPPRPRLPGQLRLFGAS